MSSSNLNSVDVVKESFSRLDRETLTSLLIIGSPYLVFNLILDFFEVSYPNSVFVILLLTIISGLVGLWYTASGWLYCHQKLSGQNITVERAFRQGVAPMGNLFLAGIILFFIFFVGFLLFIIPGIYLAIRLSLTFYAIPVENYSAIEGIKRSWELTKGHWWFIFATSLLIGLTMFVVVFVVAFVIGIILGILLGNTETLELLSNVVGTIIGYLFLPFYFIATTILYDRLIMNYKSTK